MFFLSVCLLPLIFFTKLFRPLVRHWRAQGFHFVLHLDDGADCRLDLNAARFPAETIRSDLAKAGIVANSSKSIWIPTHVVEWLGLIWNLREGFLAITQARLQKVFDSLHWLKDQLPHVTPRFLASVVGRIVSLTPGMSNVCLLMSRFLQSVINFRDSWDTEIDLSAYYPQCLAEIDFWLRNYFKLNGKAFIQYSPPVVIIHSDASDFACRGHALRVDSQEFELFFQAFSSIQTK